MDLQKCTAVSVSRALEAVKTLNCFILLMQKVYRPSYMQIIMKA